HWLQQLFQSLNHSKRSSPSSVKLEKCFSLKVLAISVSSKRLRELKSKVAILFIELFLIKETSLLYILTSSLSYIILLANKSSSSVSSLYVSISTVLIIRSLGVTNLILLGIVFEVKLKFEIISFLLLSEKHKIITNKFGLFSDL